MRKQIVSKSNFKCLTPSLTSGKIKNLQQILANKKLEDKRVLAELLSGEIRLQILYLLSIQGSLCVNDIADVLKSKVSGISHQLRLLRKANLVKTKKKQKVVIYSLAEKLPNITEVMLS